VVIDLTQEHLKLLHAVNTDMIDNGAREIAVVIDPKRPYGDMTYFELDMGTLLASNPRASHVRISLGTSTSARHSLRGSALCTNRCNRCCKGSCRGPGSSREATIEIRRATGAGRG